MKYLIFHEKKLLKSALWVQQVGNDYSGAVCCSDLMFIIFHKSKNSAFGSPTESDAESLLFQTGSRIQATAAINKPSGATPKPQLSFTHPRQEQHKKKSRTS